MTPTSDGGIVQSLYVCSPVVYALFVKLVITSKTLYVIIKSTFLMIFKHFFIVFDHESACQNMHLLVKIHNTCVCSVFVLSVLAHS